MWGNLEFPYWLSAKPPSEEDIFSFGFEFFAAIHGKDTSQKAIAQIDLNDACILLTPSPPGAAVQQWVQLQCKYNPRAPSEKPRPRNDSLFDGVKLRNPAFPDDPSLEVLPTPNVYFRLTPSEKNESEEEESLLDCRGTRFVLKRRIQKVYQCKFHSFFFWVPYCTLFFTEKNHFWRSEIRLSIRRRGEECLLAWSDWQASVSNPCLVRRNWKTNF